MPSTYEHTTKFKADISSLKSGISQANKELKKIASEYKAASSQADLMGNKQQSLKAKLEYLTKTLEQQKNKLESYKKQLETTKNYTDELRKKEDELSKKLDEAKNKFGANSSEVQKYQKELTQVQKEITSNENQMDKLNVTINNQQAIVNNAQKELNDYNKELQELEDASQDASQGANDLGNGLEGMEGAITAASSALNGIGEVVDGLTDKFENLLINGINATIQGLEYLATNVFTTGGNFEKEISLVEAHFGDNLTGSIDDVINKSEELGASTSKTATEVAESFDVLAKAGLTSDEAINIMDSIVDLSLGTQEDMTTMTNTLKNALIKFDLEPTLENASHAADLLASASTNADTDVSALGEALGTAGGMAASLGYSLDDTILALDMMAKYSLNGQEAGTALKRILLNLTSPTDELNKSIEKYGYSLFDTSGEAKELKDVLITLRDVLNDPSLTTEDKMQMESLIGGARAIEALSNLVNLSEQDFIGLQDAIYNCDGAASQMAATAQDNLLGSFDILKSAIDGVYLSIYNKLSGPARQGIDALSSAFSGLVESITNGNLAPYVDKVGDAIARVSESLPGLFEEHGPEIEKFIQTFCDFLVQIIDLLPSLVDTLLPKILDILTNVLEKAPGLIEEWAPKIIDCIGFLIENLPTIIGVLYTLKGIIATLKGILAALGLSALISKLGALGGSGGAIASVGGSLTGLLSIIGGGILILANIIAYVYLGIKAFDNMKKSLNKFKNDNTFENLKEKFNTFKDNVINKLGELKESISTWFSDRKEDITTWFSDRVQDVVDFFTNLPEKIEYGFGYIIGAVAAHLVNMANDVKQWFLDRLEDAQQFFNELPQKIDTFLFTTIPEKWNSFKETSKQNIKDFFEDKKTKIQEFIDCIPKMWEDFKTKCKTKWEEFVNGVVNKWDSFWNDVTTKKDKFVGMFENINLYEIGKNIIDGLKKGIEEKWNSLKTSIGNITDGIKAGFQNNLDIHSPSRWMKNFIGKNLMEGLSIGIEDNASSVLGSLKNLSNNIKTSIDTNALSDIQMGLIGASNNIKGHTNSVVNTSTSNVTYTPTFNYNKPLNSKEIYRQNKNMLNAVLGI